MKTVKQEEPIARSRFVDCPVCKNHSLKVKRTVQMGRCKRCNETYKVIVVFVKSGKTQKPIVLTSQPSSEKKSETSSEKAPETLPSWQLPSDSSLFGSTNQPYAGLSEALFGKNDSKESTESGSNSRQ